jgi:hypothetical protein
MAVNVTLLNSNTVANIDANFQRVVTALQDVLGRSGTGPNQMDADVDMNNNDLLNVNGIDAKNIWIDGEPVFPGPNGGGGGGGIPPGGLQQNLNMNGYNINNVGRLNTTELYVNGVPITGGGGSGGVTRLRDLTDVSITTTPDNGSVLAYHAPSQTWRPSVLDDGGVIIPPGSITEDKFEEGITPVRIVSFLPTEDNYEGRIVLLTSDGKLYRYHGGQWTTAVPALDITGQLADAQIAAINAVKIAGQITETQISDNAISTPKLAAGSVIAGKLAVGAVEAGNIATGAIVADHISANAITAGKIATNAVTADKIVAGAVSAAKMSVSNLSAISANLGTVTAGTINGININGSVITGSTLQTAASGARIVIGTDNALKVFNSSGVQVATFGSPLSVSPPMTINNPTGVGITVTSRITSDFTNVSSAVDPTVEVRSTSTSGNAHCFRGRHIAGGGIGLVGASPGGGGHAFIAETGGYAPFTGVHEAFISKTDETEVGDIVHSTGEVLATKGVDDSLLVVATSDVVNKRGNYGIVSNRARFELDSRIVALDADDPRRAAFSLEYDRLAVNGLGEGLVAVCGRGGDIEVGDYITTSTLRGKGQRQNDDNDVADDLLRRHTVAQATQAVTFNDPDEVVLIACVYRCG